MHENAASSGTKRRGQSDVRTCGIESIRTATLHLLVAGPVFFQHCGIPGAFLGWGRRGRFSLPSVPVDIISAVHKTAERVFRGNVDLSTGQLER